MCTSLAFSWFPAYTTATTTDTKKSNTTYVVRNPQALAIVSQTNPEKTILDFIPNNDKQTARHCSQGGGGGRAHIQRCIDNNSSSPRRKTVFVDCSLDTVVWHRNT